MIQYMIFGLVALVIIGGGAWYIFDCFAKAGNRVVALNNRCDTAFADIDAHLKHRHNLIPGLVSVVKGVADHEKHMVMGVVEARTEAIKAMGGNIKLEAEKKLTANIAQLFSTVEKYPELRALPEFTQLRHQLVECENRITASRRFYNLAVEEYNTSIQQYPANKVAVRRNLTPRQPYSLGVERVMIDEPLSLSF